MDSLLGVELPTTVKFFIAFVVVLALIGATTWLIRRFGGSGLGVGSPRGRQPRLAVIDFAPVDGRRRLVLIRRDNVEHLVMIGGPSDVVIEQNIVRAIPVASAREVQPGRPPGVEPAPRIPEVGAPRAEAAPVWPPDSAPRPPRLPEPEPATRQQRPVDPGPRAIAGPEPLAEEPARLERAGARTIPHAPMPAAEPMRPVEPRSVPANADANLADMAQRLEAALRRPTAVGESRGGEPPLRPSPPTEPAARRETPRPESPRPQRPEPLRVPAEPKPAQPDAAAASPKSVLDSLEQEMASLLGRPTGKE